MAHFAKLGANSKVISVLTLNNSDMLEPIAQLEDLEGLVVGPGVPRLQKQLVQEIHLQ